MSKLSTTPGAPPVDGLFLPDGDGTFVPTVAAIGPWSPDLLHGAAVAALFAGRLTPEDRTLVRLTVDLVAPVPNAPLTLEIGPDEGGQRTRRQAATLAHQGRTVAVARSLTIRQVELDLPPGSLDHDRPFDPGAAPDLSEPHPSVTDAIGWENFHSYGVATKRLVSAANLALTHQWVGLTLPVVAGTDIRGTETAAVAADFAAEAVHQRVPFDRWSFRNADMTLHLSRPPVGRWIGVGTAGMVQPCGAGIASTQLYDADGQLGQSASSLVVERRTVG